MASREEEYIRRMKARGYEPTLMGMDDDDIEYELQKMDEAERKREAEQAPGRTVYRPVDPGLKARILRMFGQTYDESAIPKGQEFYLNGWDNGDDDDLLMGKINWVEPAPPRNGAGGAVWDDPWAKAWKLDWGKGGFPAGHAKTVEYRWGRDGAGVASRSTMDRSLSFGPSGHDMGTEGYRLNTNAGGSGVEENLLIDPLGMFPQYDGGASAAENLTGGGTLDRYRSNETVTGPSLQKQNGTQTPVSMKPSEKLAEYLKTYEKYMGTPYQVSPTDPVTIGYGHVILPGEDFSGGIEESQAVKIFQRDLEKHAAVVNEWARQNNVGLTQQQFDALVSFVFNMGSIGVEGETQKVADTIKKGNATPEEIREVFGLYINNEDGVQPGLVSRRRDEADMFLNGDYRRKE